MPLSFRLPRSFGAAALLALTLAACGSDPLSPGEGSVEVTITTTGTDQDLNGYQISVDGIASVNVPSNGTQTLTGVPAGTRNVTVSGIASNCTLAGDNPRAVTVTRNQTTQLTLAVTCNQIVGSVRVITVTTGTLIDPNGFQVRAGTGTSSFVPANGQIVLNNVVPGAQPVTLENVASYCTVSGTNPRTTTVVADQQVDVTFNVTCNGVRQIAFASDRDSPTPFTQHNIYLMNEDGTAVTRVTNAAALEIPSGWHPDAQRLAFTSQLTGGGDVYSVLFNGTSRVRLTTSNAADFAPSYSPNGQKIVFASQRDGPRNIYSMNADGTGVVRLTNGNFSDLQPNYSPDGTKILFYSNRDGGGGDVYEIYTMNADGSGVTRLTNNAADDAEAMWSPDGTKIVFKSNRDAPTAGLAGYEIYVMNANGSSPVRLTNNAFNDEFPSWSPDGLKIAFDSDRDGNYEIYVMNANGTGVVRLTNNLADDFSPVWRP